MTPATSQGEIDLLIHYMPQIVRAPGLSDWERQFCVSACGKIKRGAWQPSDKQISVMRRLHAKFTDMMRDDAPMIEGRSEIAR
jgi:hypothetical protein